MRKDEIIIAANEHLLQARISGDEVRIQKALIRYEAIQQNMDAIIGYHQTINEGGK